MMRAGGCIYIRGPSKRKPTGYEFVPESFWTRFGKDTAMVDTYYEPPLITTYADIGRRKKQQQAKRLAGKRKDEYRTEIRPIYLWVFHCPGFGFAYKGWWTYLIGRHGWDSGKYLARDEKIIRQLMELFPVADTTLFGPSLTHEQWQPLFALAYACRHPDGSLRKHAGWVQGKALLWAEFHGSSFWRIIGPAHLPPRTGLYTRGGKP